MEQVSAVHSSSVSNDWPKNQKTSDPDPITNTKLLQTRFELEFREQTAAAALELLTMPYPSSVEDTPLCTETIVNERYFRDDE